MNKFKAAADVDASVLVGELSQTTAAPNRVTFAEVQSLFESEGNYFNISSPLDIELKELGDGIKTEFLANLCANIDGDEFKLCAYKIILPVDGTAYISKDGIVRAFIKGYFEAIVETTASKDNTRDILADVLDKAIDDAYSHCECVDSCGAYPMDIYEIGE